jgi:hypothetical protein
MVDLTKFSDEQLEKIAKSGAVEGSSQSQSLQNNFSSIPSSELRKIAAKDFDIGAMESIGRGALSTVTLGYAPEAIAAVKSAIGPEKFSEEVEKQKIAQEAAWEKHPYSYSAGFVGGMAPAFFTSRIAAPVATAGAGARLAYGALTSPNIASAAGKLLQNVPVIRGLGTTLEKPIVQGAIYGSSQGDTAEERLKEAGIGAVGAKIGEKIIPPVISAASAIPSAVMNTVSKYITGSPAKSKIAADLAAKHDIYLPAIVDAGPISSMVAKPDIGRNIANASAKTLDDVGGKFSALASTPTGATPESAGLAIKNSFSDWLRNGSRQELSAIYQPVNTILADQSRHYPVNLFKYRIKVENEIGNITNVSPMFAEVNKALQYAAKNGLTIDETRRLRQIVSDAINFNKINPTAGVDEKVLRNIRNFLTQDMLEMSNAIGGRSAMNAVASADREAQKNIYSVQEQLARIIGSGMSSDSKSASSVYNNLARMARYKTSDIATLEKIKRVIDPRAWEEFSKAYINTNIIPQNRFSFGNYQSAYKNTAPKAFDVMYGPSGSSPERIYIDDVFKFSNLVGPKIDQYAKRAVGDEAWGTAAALTPIFEAAVMGGLPLKSIAALGTSAVTSGRLSRDIAQALPPPNVRQNVFDYLKNNSQAGSMWFNLLNNMADQSFGKSRAKMAQFETNLRTLGGMIGSDLGIKLEEPALRALLMASGALIERTGLGTPTGQASGGRVARASGGRIIHEDAADKLIRAAEIAKKNIGKQTETILEKPDEHVVQALAVANRHI